MESWCAGNGLYILLPLVVCMACSVNCSVEVVQILSVTVSMIEKSIVLQALLSMKTQEITKIAKDPGYYASQRREALTVTSLDNWIRKHATGRKCLYG